MGNWNSERRTLEELWRCRLQDARLRLDFARNYTKEIQRDFPNNEIPSPDGAYAQQRAIRGENAALAQYRRVLEIYTNLVTRGEIPAETAWPQSKTPRREGGKDRTGTAD